MLDETKYLEVKITYGPNGKIFLKVVRCYNYIGVFGTAFEQHEALTISQLANVLKLSDRDLIDMLSQFHGTTYNSKKYPAITFKKLEYAKEAKEWLESLLTMHILIKE